MAPVYFGSLGPKKKSELQEIAAALRISDQGTKDEIVQRITKHLDLNQDELEDNPTFSGLFGRRKRSVQPQVIPNSRLVVNEVSRVPARRSIVLDPITESTPTKDLRDVSAFLQHPLSPEDIASTSLQLVPQTPAQRIINHLQNVPVVRQLREQEVLKTRNELVVSIRSFLSNSRNIWSATVIVELIYILLSIIPWKGFEIFFSKSHPVTLPYPPLVVFQTTTFWLVLFHWSLPSLIIPALIGCLITFNRALSPPHSSPEYPIAPLDPLTASIIRLAAQILYPYTSIANKTGIVGLDVLGFDWRVVIASVSLAFSVAEAIADAPANEVVRQARIHQTNGRFLPHLAIAETEAEVD